MNTSFPFPNAKTHWLSGVLTFFIIVLSLQAQAMVRYVKPTASGTGDGSSWTNASGNLQAMINASGSGDEVWVAAGTYKPTSGTDRSISFSMKNGVAIYGGFNGTETQLSQRNWRTNVTTLSGDIGISGNNSDNSYSVIVNEGINSAIFDGFTVTQANTAPPTGNLNGGGIYNAGSSPTIRNCIFSNNTGSYATAGIFNFNNGTPTIINCLFINNVGTVFSSGVINFGGSANIINSTFYGNHTAILDQGGNALSVRNCILWGNNNPFNLILPHPVTLTIANSIIQGGWSGTGNLSTDPLFVNAAGGDFRLQACSPAVNAGSNAHVPGGITTDLDGNARFYNNGTVDIGAYEFQSTPPTFVTCYRDSDNDSFGNLAMSQVFCNTCGTGYVPNGADCNDSNQAINPFAAEVCDGADNNCNTQTDEGNVCCPSGNVAYVKANATGANNGTSWTNAYTSLQSALNNNCTGITEIWVAAGTYKPTTGTDRNISFVMKNGVAIYGGFNGTETQLSQRNWRTNVTTLSGDIGAASNADNTYRVINNNFNTNAPLGSSAILDGFTVEAGNANGSFPLNLGGGMWNAYASPTVRNCIFRNNTATSGAAIFNDNSQANVINSLFMGNSCSVAGSAISNGGGTASAQVVNCTFFGNTGGSSTISNEVNATAISNCIIWGNANGVSGGTVSYSIVQGGFTGTGNLNADPLFVNAAGGDFRLQACSPAIDAGTNTGAPSTDYDGNARPFNATGLDRVDMGAYEAQTALPGVPQEFGNNVWNVYVWRSGGASIPNNNAWSTGYAGYYVDNNLDINTELRWPIMGSPSQASGYQGCTVGNDNHSYSYKRKGFPVGSYQLNVDNHDDSAELWVNGTKVWEHNGCCDAHANVWSGSLGANDELEFRVTEGTSNSRGKLSFIQCPSGNVVYVNANATGANNGTSWTDAFTDLQIALSNLCSSVTEIWVAQGTYKPTTGTDRNISFVMKNGIAIYGGFNGTETQLSQRNWRTNVTTLSGNIGAAGNADNSYSVVYAGPGLNATAILDGFTVTGAAGTTFGAGIYTDHCSATISHCLITGNSSTVFGGGLACYNASPIITDCIFSNNTSYSGGGMANGFGGMPVVTNCLFINNTATYFAGGGGLYSQNTSMTLTNCTFSGNSPESIHCNIAINISNCVIWGNSLNFYNANASINNCIIEGGYTQCLNCPNGNGNANPLFVNAAGGDFSLQACSPAIDAGNDLANDTSTDLGGSARKTDVYPGGAQIDLGAYEALSGDTQAPSMTCPANIPCIEATSPAGAVVFYPSPTAVDNCDGNVPVNAVLPSGSTFAVGLNTVVASASDSKGNSAFCSFTIEVCDRTPPTLQDMPNNISCVAATSPAGAVVTYTSPTATDIVDVVVPVTCFPASGSVFPLGSTTVICTATDAAGNIASSSFTVSVDDTPPSITCPDTQTLVLGANCTATLPNYTSLATTGDNCGVQSVTQSPAAGTTVAGTGNMSVTLTVTDANGLTNTCTFTVTKVDNTAPSITCPATQTLALGANCSATLPNYTSLASPGDNCGVQSVTQSPAAGTPVSGAGNMSVTLTVTDVNGLTNTCTFTVTKVDNTAPTITCPSNIPCIEATSPAGAVVFYPSPTAVDNCDGNVPVNAVLPSGSTFAVGLNTVVASASDSKGNSAFCSFTIEVCDRTPPTLQDMPNNISCVAATSPAGAVVTYTNPTATDIVDVVVPVTCFPASGSVFSIGSTTVICTATDAAGNIASSSFTVSVDGTPPSISCPDTQTLVLGANCTATLPNYTSLATTGDDCGVQSVTQSPAAGTSVSGAGNMSVILTATDISGLTDNCTFTVTKVDNTAPSITCPAIQTLALGANCSATLPNYTSLASPSDNCGVQGVTQSPAAGTSVSGAGNMSVTLTVTDVNGLTNTCTFTVTKVDNTAPSISCPATQTLALGASCAATLPDYTSLATPADNCGVQSVTQSPASGTPVSGAGNMSVTLTVTDVNGLTNTCTFTVTKVDNTVPGIACPAPQTLVLGGSCSAALPNYTNLASPSDNCGVQSVTQSPAAGTSVSGAGNMTVTLTVTDVNGLTNSCTFTVTKVDNTAPSITCPATQTLVLGANCSATLPNYTSLATTGDNCGVQSVTQSPAAGASVSGAGNMSVTLTVTDVNGLTNTCTFTVTKVDNTAPTITCPDTQTLALGANCSAALPDYTSLATTADGCGVQSVTQSPTAGTSVSGTGNISVTLTVTDVNGLTNTCTFTVTKVDNTAPSITCPATQTLVLGANCSATLPNYTSLATTGDNCGVQSVTQSPTAGTTVSSAGNMSVTLTVTDVNGLTNSCTFTVTKVDNTPPTLVCKNTTVFIGNTGTYTLQPADVFNATASSDNCSGMLTVTNISPAMVSCAQLNQIIPVTVTVQDASGNTATCIAQITVQEGSALPLGWSSDNVGNANGAAGYKACSLNGSFTVSANGFSTSSSDVLHFTSQQLCGNGEISVRVMAVSGGGWAGVMMRESGSPGAKKVALKTQLSNMIRREIRTVQNGPANILNFNRPQHVWLRLVRDGSTFTGYTSLNGTTWSFAFSATVSMPGCIQLGVFSESINANTTTTATFSNIAVTGASNNSLTNSLPDTQIAAEQNEEVRVFPNPTTGEVTIDLDIYAGKPGTIQVFNALGALTTQERLIPGNPETLRLRIGDLAGVYLVIIQVEDRRIVRRVVVN